MTGFLIEQNIFSKSLSLSPIKLAAENREYGRDLAIFLVGRVEFLTLFYRIASYTYQLF
jgi:hypothetical protein